MKAYFYGTPDRALIQWAFNLKARWPRSRFFLIVPVVIMFAVLGPLAWSMVKIGTLGHWLAFKLGVNSREVWE